MFGFGQKKATEDFLSKIRSLCQVAVDGIAGSLESGRLVLRDFDYPLNPVSRKKLSSEMTKIFTTFSKNPDNWKGEMNSTNERLRNSDKPSQIESVAFALLASIIKMNLLCKIALEFPKDQRVKNLVLETIALNSEALDYILSDSKVAGAFEPSPSFEWFEEMIYIKRFMDLNI